MSDIINFADLVIKRNYERLNKKQALCHHLKISYSKDDMSIECEDCGASIDSFKAFMLLIDRHKIAWRTIKTKESELNSLLTKNLHLKAARIVCNAWSKRNMVPTCPHCDEAIFPDDGFGGRFISKEIAIQKKIKFNYRR